MAEGGDGSFARTTRFHRLVNDDERYPTMIEGLHIIAFVSILLEQAEKLAAGS